MATRAGLCEYPAKGVAKVTWSGLLDAGNDVGDGQDFTRWGSVTIQVKGTFDTSASVSIQGSNDGGTTWHTLNDDRGEGNAMTFTAGDTRKLNEIPQLIRPNVTAGSGGSNLVVIAVARGER